jgi:hypothetical protein
MFVSEEPDSGSASTIIEASSSQDTKGSRFARINIPDDCTADLGSIGDGSRRYSKEKHDSAVLAATCSEQFTDLDAYFVG